MTFQFTRTRTRTNKILSTGTELKLKIFFLELNKNTNYFASFTKLILVLGQANPENKKNFMCSWFDGFGRDCVGKNSYLEFNCSI